MRQLRFFLAICILSVIATVTYAQSGTTKTETFKVSGKCEMCKSRIEKSAKTNGVTSAEWITKTKMLTITYDPSKTSKDAVAKNLASIGHDTEKYKAPDDVYKKLPGCCHYERK